MDFGGNWSGAHALQWDMNAPVFGDLTVGDGFRSTATARHSRQRQGERFLEGRGSGAPTHYAKVGQVISSTQPGRWLGRLRRKDRSAAP